MADLITLPRLKTAMGYAQPSAVHPDDPKLTAAIAGASAMIRNYTGLKFEVASGSVATTRSFEYDGSGYLDIDEAQTITTVVSKSGYTTVPTTPMSLSVDEWGAYPLNLPVKLWLRLAEAYYGRGISPEMGFTYNLDTLAYKYPFKPNIIDVTAIWGWPAIPEDIQQAAIWTAVSINESPKPYASEAIENYSRTRGPGDTDEAIPIRAQVILDSYIWPKI